MTDAPVLTEIRGHLGLITLNRPKAVNALSFEMLGLIDEALDAFEADQNVAVVALVGAGDRGLCAGGDVRALYEACVSDPSEGLEFFRREYTLDLRISRFPKPYVAVMSGLVLGGGLGISAPGSHRVATESTRAGMPETGIGFSPDVAGTNHLAKAPGLTGLHLALTGFQADAADALYAHLADYFVPETSVEELLTALQAVENPGEVAGIIEGFAPEELPESKLATDRPWIDAAYDAPTVEEILENLRDAAESNGVAAEAVQALAHHSPTGLKTALEAYRRAGDQTLAQTLEQDFRTSGNAILGHDMREGIRAQVVDKDRNPQWEPARLEDVSAADVEAFFDPVPDTEDLCLQEDGTA